MPVFSEEQSSDPSAESTVDPVVELSAYQRRVAALKAHRPGSLPAQFLGRVRKPHEQVKAMAEIVYGQTAADALDALIRPNSRMDRGVARRAMDLLFPKDRPVALAISDANSPQAFNQAMTLIHDAWTSGRISPQEALTCQELVERRYKAWLKYLAGEALR